MTGTAERELSGWGRYPVRRSSLRRPERYRDLDAGGAHGLIARGQGRAYGDAALADEVVLTERLNRFLSFDTATGVIRAEAGATLAELLEVSVPAGWFPSITPGTRFVSLGGCVAADVHGKSHHVDGAFSNSVREIELLLADGTRLRCSREHEAEAFWATAGGMGLTGLIGEVELRLRPIETSLIRARHFRATNLEESFRMLSDTEHDAPYTVAWLDVMRRGQGMGRGVVMVGDHARREELPNGVAPLALPRHGGRRVPLDMPGWMLNPLTIHAFNTLYYRIAGSRSRPFLTDYEPFFYPLDAILDWNRLYGRRGFVQYQCVWPTESAFEGCKALIEALGASGHSAFLNVLKRFGPGNPAPLSFPMAGYTLAMDLPVTGPALLAQLDRFDDLVLRHGGRVYLAKDARLKPETFRAMYPRLPEWQRVQRRLDPDGRFQSDLSRRLRMTEPA